MTWRFLDTGIHNGPSNMAVDETLVEACGTRRSCGVRGSLPVLRVYGWSPWTISLGRMENAERRLDLDACRRDGVPIVRRPTGGRAVFHAEELTYSVIARPSDLPVAATVGALYRFVAEVLVAALQSLGVPAEILPPERSRERSRERSQAAEVGEAGREMLRGSPCFASVSRYEICVGGKKLVGSAQRTWPDVMLQHGSILLGPAHARIETYLRGGGGTARSRGMLAARTTSVSEVLGREIDPLQITGALMAAAKDVWGVPMVEQPLTDAEQDAVRERVDSKYGTDEWNLLAQSLGRMNHGPVTGGLG